MCTPRILLIYIILFGVYSLNLNETYGKGLDELEPPAESETSGASKPSEESLSAVKGGSSDEFWNEYIVNKLAVATSFGLSDVRNGSENWRGSGMSDIFFTYDLGISLFGGGLFGTFRYAPMDVAPQVFQDGQDQAYTGVIEHYLAGAEYRMLLGEEFWAVGDAELGLVFTHLNDQVGLPDEKQPEDTGFLLNVGGGLDWQLLKKFRLGPRLRVGLGSFTTIQLSGHATFAF